MPLVVEDGTGKPDATSYASLATIRAYALDRGVDLSVVTDPALTAFAILATDYLESRAKEYVGCPTTIAQALSFPRQGISQSDGTAFPSNAIPKQLVNAECQLCIEQNNGVVLLPTSDFGKTGFVVSERVESIETRYSERIGTVGVPVMPAVEMWLKSLLRFSGLNAVRV